MTRNRWPWLCAVLLAAGVVVFAPLPVISTAPGERVIRVQASQFAYAPGEIRVNTGDIVTLELVSTDVAHGLYVDGYNVSVTADPGQTEQLTFKADRPGTFRFRCNVTCGAMHPFMIGKLNVGGDEELLRAMGLALVAAASVILLPRKII